jgi:ribonuclease R
VDQFTEAAASLGLQLPKFELSPDWFAAVLKKAVDTPTEYVLNNLLLRTMQQARYSPDNQGHFGLAAQYYLHFTSPIRRYPDLIAHRVLHNFLIGSKNDNTGSKQLTPDNLNLIEAGLHLSHQERISVDIERNVHARLSTLFFKDRVGEKFQAVISGVTPFGLFIELTDYFISGAIPVQEMRDDYYIHDSRGHRLIGDLTAKTHQLGNLVEVQLTRVDMISKKLYFSLDITTP